MRLPLIGLPLCFTNSYAQEWKVDALAEWLNQTGLLNNLSMVEATDRGGVIGLMGNGALLLQKVRSESLYTRSSEAYSSGKWISSWYKFGMETTLNSIEISILAYGRQLDMRNGWTKFNGNPP